MPGSIPVWSRSTSRRRNFGIPILSRPGEICWGEAKTVTLKIVLIKIAKWICDPRDERECGRALSRQVCLACGSKNIIPIESAIGKMVTASSYFSPQSASRLTLVKPASISGVPRTNGANRDAGRRGALCSLVVPARPAAVTPCAPRATLLNPCSPVTHGVQCPVTSTGVIDSGVRPGARSYAAKCPR